MTFRKSDGPSPAIELIGKQRLARQKVRQRCKQDVGNLLIGHEAALSAFASMSGRFSGQKFDQLSTDYEHLFSLIVLYFRAVDLTETAISEGLYHQAAALLKQEHETVAAIYQIRDGSRKEGKTPHARKGNIEGSAQAKIYRLYNDIAHMARERWNIHLARFEKGELSGPTLMPTYKAEVIPTMFGMHTYYLWDTAISAGILFEEIYGESYSVEETGWLMNCYRFLMEADVIR